MTSNCWIPSVGMKQLMHPRAHTHAHERTNERMNEPICADHGTICIRRDRSRDRFTSQSSITTTSLPAVCCVRAWVVFCVCIKIVPRIMLCLVCVCTLFVLCVFFVLCMSCVVYRCVVYCVCVCVWCVCVVYCVRCVSESNWCASISIIHAHAT